jgi:hypothetical protein
LSSDQSSRRSFCSGVPAGGGKGGGRRMVCEGAPVEGGGESNRGVQLRSSGAGSPQVLEGPSICQEPGTANPGAGRSGRAGSRRPGVRAAAHIPTSSRAAPGGQTKRCALLRGVLTRQQPAVQGGQARCCAVRSPDSSRRLEALKRSRSRASLESLSFMRCASSITMYCQSTCGRHSRGQYRAAH